MKRVRFLLRKKSLNMKQLITDAMVTVYSLLPRNYRKKIEREKTYAGIEGDKSAFCGAIMLIMWLIGLVETSVLFFTFGVPLHLAVIPMGILFPFGYFLPYLIFTYLADARRKRMEVVLPDILMLISANIKSGLTIDRAILFASRPEFGELSDEFKKVAFEIYGGEEVSEAFRKMLTRIKSIALERTVKLLLEGLKSGGTIASLLEETANDLRNVEVLQREIRSNVSMYMMFIFLAGVVAAPFLFAISKVLINTSSSAWGTMNINQDVASFMGGGFISLKPTKIDTGAFSLFSILCLSINIIFASMLISIIQHGDAKAAIKYIPLFMVIAFAIYYGSLKAMSAVFQMVV